jgi:protein-L-isoaspartate(D-aspartate) O-methyltransferase
MVQEQIAKPLDYRTAVTDPRVLSALREVPRHLFVPEDMRDIAYADRPLPIGHGQTISQPYIVAAMTELLQPQPDHIVLEVGTGCGYQAAVLARLVKQVYSIEIVRPLAEQAERNLVEHGFDNVLVRAGDGYAGWPEHAPFDGIIVTAAPDQSGLCRLRGKIDPLNTNTPVNYRRYSGVYSLRSLQPLVVIGVLSNPPARLPCGSDCGVQCHGASGRN